MAAAGGAAVPSTDRWRARWQSGWQRWISRRIPPARQVLLSQKQLFIFPTRTGLFFLLSLLVMLVTAINYQNNMTFALTFLLANLFVVAVLHTYANLAGISLTAVAAMPAFPGQQAEFRLRLQAPAGRARVALELGWPGGSQEFLSLAPGGARDITLYCAAEQRGWFRPGRLRVESTYPLGLLRCWTWVDLDIQALVYPSPQPSGPLQGVVSARPDGAAEPMVGDDDFYGFRDYRPGDSLRRVHWAGLARGQRLQTRMYNAYADRSLWLDWEMFSGLGVEQRLSHLCYWVLDCDRNRDEFGLRLPDTTLPPAVGDSHRLEALRLLALYGLSP